MWELLKSFLNSNFFIALITIFGLALPAFKMMKKMYTDKKWAIAALYVESHYYLALAIKVYERLQNADFFAENITTNITKWKPVVEKLIGTFNSPIYSSDIRIHLETATKTKGITSYQAKRASDLLNVAKQIETLIIDLEQYIKLKPEDKGMKEKLETRINHRRVLYMDFMSSDNQSGMSSYIQMLRDKSRCLQDIKLHNEVSEDYEYIKLYRASRERREIMDDPNLI